MLTQAPLPVFMILDPNWHTKLLFWPQSQSHTCYGWGQKKNKSNKNKINKIIIRLFSLQPFDHELVKSWLSGAHMNQTHKIGASNIENYLLSGKLLKNFHFVLLFT
jgi:hypothetical protein